MRNIVKYVGIALVIIGILLVMKNLVSKDTDWSSSKKEETKEVYYNARIKLLDKENDAYLAGGKLILKDEKGDVIGEWTTEEGVHLVNKLAKGKYTLIEEEAPENYHLNEESISFEIKNTDKEVIMYNTKMTEEEIAEERIKNTISNEVGVDNTLSNKNIFSTIMAITIAIIGVGLIYKEKKNYQ